MQAQNRERGPPSAPAEIVGGKIISLEGNTSEEGKKFYWETFNKTPKSIRKGKIYWEGVQDTAGKIYASSGENILKR